jgi:hypothetical protein
MFFKTVTNISINLSLNSHRHDKMVLLCSKLKNSSYLSDSSTVEQKRIVYEWVRHDMHHYLMMLKWGDVLHVTASVGVIFMRRLCF